MISSNIQKQAVIFIVFMITNLQKKKKILTLQALAILYDVHHLVDGYGHSII